jgi:hypothetical protein
MKKLVARLPSPALVVASVALIAALSGTAIGLPGKNTVDSGDIKNNSVKGKDVAEGSLAAVPNASNAGTLGGKPASSFAQASQLAALANEDQVLSLAGAMDTGDPAEVLDVWGPFTFTATCIENMGVIQGLVTISTTAQNGFVDAQFNDTDFDAGETVMFMENVNAVANSIVNTDNIRLWDADSEFSLATGPDSHFAVMINTAGAECRFTGYATGPDL